MSIKYTYSISEDFSNGVSSDRLIEDIRQSDIVIAIDYINTLGDDCDMYFKSTLSPQDETVLDTVVSGHTGLPLSDSTITSIVGGEGNTVGVSSEKRLLVDIMYSPHAINGDAHTGILDDIQIPESIVRNNELLTLSGTLYDDINIHTGNLDIHRQLDDNIISTNTLWSSYKIKEYTDLSSDYVRYDVYVSSAYGGAISDGSNTKPFSNLADAFTFINNTYSGINDYVVLNMLPGVYYLDQPTDNYNPALKSVIGTSPESTIFKPTEALLGGPILNCHYLTKLHNTTLDCSDIPEMLTTSGTVGILVSDPTFNEIGISNVNIIGVYTGISIENNSNLYCKETNIYKTQIALNVTDNSMIDIDNMYIRESYQRFLCAHGGSQAFLSDCEFYSDETISGTGVYAYGDGTYIELFGGTNLWSLDKNIELFDNAELKIDNCVLEETGSTPGISQSSNSKLTIVNSRVPLDLNNVAIENPENVYINSFDFSNEVTIVGNFSDQDQNLVSIANGYQENPKLLYNSNHNTSYKALMFSNPNPGQKTELGVTANNANAAAGIHVVGTDAFVNIADMGFVSEQDGIRVGWDIGKQPGATPQFKISNKSNITALLANYDGSIQLCSGIAVNTILDEDDLSSNSAIALASQQSIKTYIDNNTYSTTALDAGQLDNRYYTEEEVDSWRSTIHHTASGTEYINSAWESNSVEDALNCLTKYSEDVLGSGRVSTEDCLVWSDINTITVLSGTGFISYSGFHKYLSWSETIIDTGSDIEGPYYIYVDSLGVVNKSSSNPGYTTVINLGYYYHSGERIATIGSNGDVINNALNRVSDVIRHLGPFIYDGGGLVQIVSGYESRLVSSACKVQRGLRSLDLDEINTFEDAGTNYYSHFKSSDIVWDTDFYNLIEEGGNVAIDRWNDTTKGGKINTSYQCTFTNGSNVVTSSGNLTSEVIAGDRVYQDPDSLYYMSMVSGINWDGNNTNIVLYNTYKGPSATTNAYIVKSLPFIPEGKFAKHMMQRTLDGKMRLIHSQAVFDDFTSALEAGAPEYPTEVAELSLRMAYIIVTPSSGTLTLRDIRPLPFDKKDGGSQTGGSSNDHGDLTGLTDDDHPQYLKSDGSRNLTSAISYNSHPAFSSATQLIDKKYVDDALSGLTTDHGALTGLSDDDHSQYHNDSRGDNRYYTKTLLDAGQLDSRYYTETEINTLLAANIYTDLPVCQVRRTTNFSIPTAWQDVQFDTTDIQNYTTVLQHNSTYTERIDIKEAGVYLVAYNAQILSATSTTFSYARVFKNNTTIIPGSTKEINTYPGEVQILNGRAYYTFQANDYVTLQLYTPGNVTATADIDFVVSRSKGIKGDTGADGIDGVDGVDGAPGSGSTLIVKDEGINVANTPHSAFNFVGTGVTVSDGGSGVATVTVNNTSGITIKDEGANIAGTPHTILNFIGAPVTATNAGGGQANITIAPSTFGTWYAWGGDESETNTNSTTPVQKATLSVTGIPSGYYRISWCYEWRRNSGSSDFMARFQIDNTTTIMEQSQEPQDANSWHLANGFYIANLTAGNHFFDLDYYGESALYTNYVRRARIEFWRVA